MPADATQREPIVSGALERSDLARFGLVSALGVAVDLSVAWTLSYLLGVPLAIAATIGFTVAALLNYALHERWTFGGGNGLSALRGGLYLLTAGVALATRLAAVVALQAMFSLGRGQELVALVPAVGLSFSVNYLLSKYGIFRGSAATVAQAPSALPDTTAWAVPAHLAQVHREKLHDFALVIPVIDEGERIRAQLRRTFDARLPVDVVVADGGSADGSLDDAILSETGVRALLVKQAPGRLSAQLRMAYAWCLRQGYAGIVTIDGNGKDDVRAVAAFVDTLRDGYDYVQGSRYRPGGKAENTPLERTIGNRFVHAPLMTLAGRRRFTDTTNGFRGYSRRYLVDPRVQPFRDVFTDYELLFYLTVRAGQIGLRVCEIPVRRSYPRDQETPTKITGLRAKLAVLEQLLLTVAGKFHPR